MASEQRVDRAQGLEGWTALHGSIGVGGRLCREEQHPSAAVGLEGATTHF